MARSRPRRPRSADANTLLEADARRRMPFRKRKGVTGPRRLGPRSIQPGPVVRKCVMQEWPNTMHVRSTRQTHRHPRNRHDERLVEHDVVDPGVRFLPLVWVRLRRRTRGELLIFAVLEP